MQVAACLPPSSASHTRHCNTLQIVSLFNRDRDVMRQIRECHSIHYKTVIPSFALDECDKCTHCVAQVACISPQKQKQWCVPLIQYLFDARISEEWIWFFVLFLRHVLSIALNESTLDEVCLNHLSVDLEWSSLGHMCFTSFTRTRMKNRCWHWAVQWNAETNFRWKHNNNGNSSDDKTLVEYIE